MDIRKYIYKQEMEKQCDELRKLSSDHRIFSTKPKKKRRALRLGPINNRDIRDNIYIEGKRNKQEKVEKDK